MNAHRYELPVGRSPVERARRTRFWLLVFVALVAVVELAGTVAVIPGAHAAPLAAGPSVAPAVAHVPAAPAPAAGGGDLLITPANSPYYLPSAKPPAGKLVYYQGGNITVQAGATLYVENTTLTFVNFVGDTGTAAQRLSHIFRFVNDGTVVFRNSSLTTDTFLLNPYAKLDIVDNGSMTFWNSSVETAGILGVGGGGTLTFNQSRIAPNLGARTMDLVNLTRSDMSFAPTLSVQAGGTANLFSTVYRGLYSDNFTRNGTPGKIPLSSATLVTISNASSTSAWTTDTSSDALTSDFAYPNGIRGGQLTILYNGTFGTTTVTPTIVYGGTPYALAPITLVPTLLLASINDSFSPALVHAIDTAGMLTYLNRTGDFGTPSGITVTFHISSGPNVPFTSLGLSVDPALSFGASVNGAGSHLNTVDAFVGLTFNEPGSPAWTVHQLNLTKGAAADLGNLSVFGRLDGGVPLDAQSILNADATSHAFLFRWAAVQLFGKGGLLPVGNATLTASYAYPSDPNFAIAHTANDFQTSDPAIWGYLQSWDAARSIAAYGESDPGGVSRLLLADAEVTQASGPDGEFLGAYTANVTPPAGSGATQSFSAHTSPFPLGVANSSVGYAEPDAWGILSFPLYYAQVAVNGGGIAITADGVAATTVRIGQVLGVAVTVTDNGPARIGLLQLTLYYNSTSVRLNATTAHVSLTAPGQHTIVSTSWRVNDTVVGLRGRTITDAIFLVVTWNHGLPSFGGGTLNTSVSLQFAPSAVAVGTPTGPLFPDGNGVNALDGSRRYLVTAAAIYNGSQSSSVSLSAFPVGGGAPIFLGAGTNPVSGVDFQDQSVSVVFAASLLHPGTQYTLKVTVTYNAVSVSRNLPGTYEVPSPAAKNFLFTKVLGEPLWLWLAIAGAVVAALLGFFMFTRRQAAGKVVECGECGNLIPETAKSCPKCGAEFESDVVRCSRCSSTIPANSQYCPECAAQLLGKPGEEAQDPERQAYADFTERYRAEAKKDLGENYSEGAFWDWWKRQPTYTPFSQWRLQQAQGTSRSGMTAPPQRGRPPSGGGAGGGPVTRRPASGAPPSGPRTGAAPAAGAGAMMAPPPADAPPAAAPASDAMRPCPNCGKEIPREYLVCPFCGSVTQ